MDYNESTLLAKIGELKADLDAARNANAALLTENRNLKFDLTVFKAKHREEFARRKSAERLSHNPNGEDWN